MTEADSPAPALHLYVWQDRFLYVGPSKATSMHRNHACAWLTAADGELRVSLAGDRILEGDVIYLPSGTEYATVSPAAVIAALFWEPESEKFKRIAERFENVPHAMACPQTVVESWLLLQNPATTLAQADALIARLFGIDPASLPARESVDARVLAAMHFLRDSPQDYGSIDALAERVHLSSSRFAHLFKAALGVPVRRYVLWMKLRRALDLAIAGDSLTSAALSAGFADSAHLSRTVRSMLGIAPEFLFRHRERLIVHK
jgi:AraC-like DNA-binding protein